MVRHLTSFVFLVVIFSSCHPSKQITKLSDDRKIEMIIVQVNDVYEIAPVAGGSIGGMARIATLKKELLKKNPNTLLVIAGDFLSPSVYNSLKYEGKRIRGRQMIEVMNAAGFNIAVFGNHEFDINEEELQERINESKFQWISSNSFLKQGKEIVPFAKQTSSGTEVIPSTKIISIKDSAGTTAKIGFIGLNIPFNTSHYVAYTDPVPAAKILYEHIKDSCDAVIAITHQSVEEDIKLAKAIPQLAVIVGGHEHDMRFEKEGNIYITKAHSNARSAFIIKLTIDKKTKKTIVAPQLISVDSTIAKDSVTDAVVKKWTAIASENYASLGFDPKKVILALGDSLEGRETLTRSGSTNFTKLIVQAIAEVCPHADLVMINSGSLRLDDVLYPPVTQYDILRSLPFGGAIREVEMKGRLLKQVLDAGEKNKGSGGYLQYQPIITTIDSNQIYRVGMLDFLLTGGEANMHYLNTRNPFITRVYPEHTAITDPMSDIRLAIIRYLESHPGAGKQ